MATIRMTHDELVCVTVGVDTHKDTHVARAKDQLGRRLGTPKVVSTTAAGYQELLEWAQTLGHVEAFGIEGTGSWGAGLARYLTAHEVLVLEVSRPDRQSRRRHGKSDPTDADAAASAVLSGDAIGLPKSGSDTVEMIRVLRIARHSAIKARTQAMNALHAVLVTAPDDLRATLRTLSGLSLVCRCARLHPGPLITPAAAAKSALRSLATRYQCLEKELAALGASLDKLVAQAGPGLVALFGVGTDTAGALLVAAGDNPERLHSEAAFSMLCGSSPVEASSGLTTRHRLNRGGDRQANAALHRIVIVRLCHNQATKDYALRRTAQGKSKRDIIRCLKRYVAREIYHVLSASFTTALQEPIPAVA